MVNRILEIDMQYLYNKICVSEDKLKTLWKIILPRLIILFSECFESLSLQPNKTIEYLIHLSTIEFYNKDTKIKIKQTVMLLQGKIKQCPISIN